MFTPAEPTGRPPTQLKKPHEVRCLRLKRKINTGLPHSILSFHNIHSKEIINYERIAHYEALYWRQMD